MLTFRVRRWIQHLNSEIILNLIASFKNVYSLLVFLLRKLNEEHLFLENIIYDSWIIVNAILSV